jgi:hypothetical protein
MKKILLLSMALLCMASITVTAQQPSTITVKKFTFTWQVKGDSLTCSLTSPTGGWVACGFKPTKKMKDANIIIGNIKDGKATVVDHFGIGAVEHKADTAIGGTSDLTAASCTEKDGKTTLSFTIPLNSKDKMDVTMTKGETIKVIFAAGKSDRMTTKHSKRTSTKITL